MPAKKAQRKKSIKAVAAALTADNQTDHPLTERQIMRRARAEAQPEREVGPMIDKARHKARIKAQRRAHNKAADRSRRINS